MKTLLSVICLIGFTYGLEQCYDCSTENGDTNCEDPFNIATVKSIKCIELTYDEFTRNSNTINKLRSMIVVKNNDTPKYGCLKAVVKTNSTISYTRGCVRTVREVHNDCDLLKETLDSFSEVLSCSVCNDKDDCNSGTNLTISLLLLAFSFLIVTYRM